MVITGLVIGLVGRVRGAVPLVAGRVMTRPYHACGCHRAALNPCPPDPGEGRRPQATGEGQYRSLAGCLLAGYNGGDLAGRCSNVSPAFGLLWAIAILAIGCGVAAFGLVIAHGIAGREPMTTPLVAALALIALLHTGASFFVPRC